MTLTNYAEFYVWAENQLLQKTKELPQDKLNQRIEGVDRNLKDLIVHLVSTYDYYFLPQTKQAYTDITNEVKELSIDELLQRWGNSVEKFAKEMKENQKKNFEIPGKNNKTLKVPAVDWFLLYTDHSSYHRGQIMSFIKLLGGDSVNTDYFTYYYKTKMAD